MVLLTIQPYDFEIKYIPGKEVTFADAVSRFNPQNEMELKGLDFTTWMNPMHDTNTDVNDMFWTEIGCKNAVIDPRVCFKDGSSTARGGPSPQGIGPWDMISALRMAALHIWVSYSTSLRGIV